MHKQIKKKQDDVDFIASRELELYAENDEEIYRTTHIPFVKNYKRKMDKGVFNNKLALKGIRNNYVPRVIKKYYKEFGKFEVSPQTKDQLAKDILETVIQDAKEKNPVY